MRAQARTSFRALVLILLMLTSTQLVLLTARDYTPKELDPPLQRFDVLDNSEVVKIMLADSHGCAIGSENQMKCWGAGGYGKTGHENSADYGDEELEMGQYLMFTDVGSGLTFSEVSGGEDSTCALLNDASVKCWGRNFVLGSSAGVDGSGAKGDGYQEMGSNVDKVKLGSWDASAIDSGGMHTCAIVNDSSSESVVCWGDNDAGQLGLGNTDVMGDTDADLVGGELPHVDLPDRGQGISQIATGSTHSCVLWDDGEMACWGENGAGELGVGNSNNIGDEAGEMGDNLVLVDLPTGTTAASIAAGEGMTCAILDNGELACWGLGTDGRLGSESTSNLGDSASELGDNLNIVDMGSGYTVESVDVGSGHSCAILDDGDGATDDILKCWGLNTLGQLGLGHTMTRGDQINEMGNYLAPGGVDLGSDVYPIAIEAGEDVSCALLNNSMVKCWGSGNEGRAGLGKSGATGDEVLSGVPEMGDNLPYIELYLPEPTFDQPCDSSAEGAALVQTTLDDTNGQIGNKIATTLDSGSCGALVYADDVNRVVKFAVFDKGRWVAEIVSVVPSEIVDLGVAMGSDDSPHIVVMVDSRWPVYYSKVGGEWIETSPGGESPQSATAVDIEVDGDGNLYLFTLNATDMGIKRCSSSCTDSGQWSLVGDVDVTSGGYGLDSDISTDGTMWVSYIDSTEGSSGDHEVELSSCSSNCNSLGNWQQVIISNLGDISTTNQSLGIDMGLEGSVHVAHNNLTSGLQYSSCASSCSDSSSWSTEDIESTYDSGVVDIAVGPDLSVVILVDTPSGSYALHKTGGSWDYVELLSNDGGNGWAGLEITALGQMWSFVYYPSTASPLNMYRQVGMTTAGLLNDIDGDGWTRQDEDRCGSDYTNPSSYPSDSDSDGQCDTFDGWSDDSLAAESDALAVGEGFACAIGAFSDDSPPTPLTNYSVVCWGDNSEGQLGNSDGASTNGKAVFVDLPAGFQASSIEAGTAHVCATGLDGTLVCWGRNSEGQLGRGTATSYEAPGYVTLPPGISVGEFSAGPDHNCINSMTGGLYCWGNGANDRTGNITNPSDTVVQYENFTGNGRAWTSENPTYYWGPAEGYSQIERSTLRGAWEQWDMSSAASFNVTPGDFIAFNLKGRYFGNNGGSSEWIKIWADGQLISQIDSNSTTSGSSWSDWSKVSVTVPDSYTGSGQVSINIESRIYYGGIIIDDLRVIDAAYGSHTMLSTPTQVNWDDATGISQMTLGERHSCALMVSSQVHCWGHNGGAYAMVLGNHSYKGQQSYEPKRVDLTSPTSLVSSNWTSSSVSGITSGADFTCALMQSSESVCWGSSQTTQVLGPSITTLASAGDVGATSALTTDSSGNWVIAYNDGSGISYARYNGSAWTTSSVCAASDECDSDGGLGVAEGPDGRMHFLSYDGATGAPTHTRLREEVSTSAAITDESPNYISVARDGVSGDLHLTYYQTSEDKLMHKTFDGSAWSSPVVIDDSHSYDGHSINGLEADSSGELHMSYIGWDTGGTDVASLMYAHFDGAVWSTTELQTVTQEGPVRHTSLALDSNDRPRIAYYDSLNDTLRYTYYDGATWTDSTVTSGGTYDRGAYPSIALDSSDRPRISYYNDSSDDLEIAVWDGAAWSFEIIDSTGTVGLWTSISIDSSDNTHIAYFDDSSDDIMYASHDGSSWAIQTIDDSGGNSKVDLGLDGNDRPRIAYATSTDAKFAYNNSDTWTEVEVWESDDVGGHVSLELDDSTGAAYLAYTHSTASHGMLSTIYTGTVSHSEAISSGGASSGIGPQVAFSGTSMLAAYLNGASDPDQIELATQHSAETSISMIEGDGYSVGAYGISMALDELGNRHIAYYNSSQSSLMYSKFDGSSWTTEEVDNSGTTGRYASIAVDSEGRPHISYVHADSLDEVRYAYHNGTDWEVVTVDNPYYAYDTSITLDSGGSAHISYAAYNSSGGSYNLRYSYHDGSQWAYEDVNDYSSSFGYSSTGQNNQIEINSTGVPHVVFFDDYHDDVYISIRSGGTWSSTSVDGYGGQYTTQGERGAALAIDSSDGLHVAFYDMGGSHLEYAYRALGESSWAKTVVHDQGNDYIGTSLSMALDSNDRPHIAYHDRTYWDLEYAWHDGSSWMFKTLERDQNVGRNPSIAIDSHDNVHIAYENYSSYDLSYLLLRNGDVRSEQVAQVGTHHYGMGYAIDSDGTVHMSFYNGSGTAGGLQYAVNSGGAWTVTTIDSSSTQTGLHSSLAIDSNGMPHISYVDETNNAIRYAYYDGTTWVLSTAYSGGGVNFRTSITLDDDDHPMIAYLGAELPGLSTLEWDGSAWNRFEQDSIAGSGIGQSVHISVNDRGEPVISYYDADAGDLLFSLGKSYVPLVLGSSTYHQTGTSLGAGQTGISSISVGQGHGCAVAGTAIKCWGSGSGGVLGNGASSDSADPVEVSAVAGWTPIEVVVSPSVSAGLGTTCALYNNDADGYTEVRCWGEWDVDGSGQDSPQQIMMDGGTTPVYTPSGGSETISSKPTDIVQIDQGTGSSHACARSREGHVKCWGNNANGQLGHGNTSTASDGPNEMGDDLAFVELGSNRTATDIAVGSSHACAILDNGSVKCWGNNANGRTGYGTGSGSIGDAPGEMGDSLATLDLGAGRTATAIDAGTSHTCALLDDGSVKCWGSGSYGALGIGNTTSMGDGAYEMGDDLPAVDLGTGRYASRISVAGYHSCAILDSGVVKCWGYNYDGRLGQGHTENIGTGLDADGNGISCHPSLITDANTRECNARMGNDLSAIDLGVNRTAIDLSAGETHVCAILDNGSVKCWGSNSYGATGLGSGTGNTGDDSGEMGDDLATVDIGSKKAVAISSGKQHTCVLLDDLQPVCWGNNGRGQLGVGSTTTIGDGAGEMGENLANPDLPTAFTISIVAGNEMTCAIIDDNTVRCWGENDGGRLGVYREGNDNIGVSIEDMGTALQITDLQMSAPDYDNDGWIDLWDADDDNDGYIDTNDDLPFDVRDWIDDDLDGIGVNTDTDDDDETVTTADQDTAEKWSDAEEAACGTLWWSSLSEPSDYDGDGICDALDSDVDGNGWNDTYQTECYGGEPDAWSHRGVWDGSGDWPTSTYDSPRYGYDFLISDHGIRVFSTRSNDYSYYGLIKFDGTTSGVHTTYEKNMYDFWSVQEQNGIVYLTDEAGIARGIDSSTTISSVSNMATHSSTNSHDTAISTEGDMVVRWYEGGSPDIKGWYLNGTTFEINVPEGLSANSDHHAQIAFGPNGRLHLLMVNISANPEHPVGFYHYTSDLGSSLSGESTVTWSAPQLVLERNQSTSWSHNTDYSNTDHHRADLHVGSDGTVYAAMYNQTNLWFGSFDGSWDTEMIASGTGYNEGVDIQTNSTGVAYVAWINHTSDKLMISHKSGGGWVSEEVWQSNGWENSNSLTWRSYARLTLQFDRQDDPFLMSMDANDTGSAILHHKGLFLDPAYTFTPTDAGGDGVCDTLQFAVVDYGATYFELVEGQSFSQTPSFSGQALVEVWAPTLPPGLTINSTTGAISGTPTSTDTGGTNYTIYSNSSGAQYNVSITFYVRSPSPIFAGYGWTDNFQYPSYREGIGFTQQEYDSDGNLYYYGRYYSNSAWSSDGITISGLDSNDGYLAKRWSNGTWAWVVPFDSSGSLNVGELVVDDEGNAYVSGHRDGSALDLPGTSHDLPSRFAAFVVSLDRNGSVRWAEDAYLTSGSTSARLKAEGYASTNNWGSTRMHVDNATGVLTWAGALYAASSSDRSFTFGSVSLEVESTNWNYFRPFVARVDGSGNFTWASSVTPGDSYNNVLQGMVVQSDGSVEILMRTYGTTTLGSHTTSSSTFHYILGSLNESGNWTGASKIVSESPAGFDSTYDSAMMQKTSDGDLIVVMWLDDDGRQINVSGSTHWFNESFTYDTRTSWTGTCSDTMLTLRLNGANHSAEDSRKDCLINEGGENAHYYSQILVDDSDRTWLFLGTRDSYLGYHNRVLRLDSDLNLDFEQFLNYADNIVNGHMIDWDDVAFDPDGNVLASIYSTYSSLYWGSTYMSYENYEYRTFILIDRAVSHSIDGAAFIYGEAFSFGPTALGTIGATDTGGAEYLDSWEISPPLPNGLSLNSDTGVISGTAVANMSETTFTMWMNDTEAGNIQITVSFTILDGKPTVTYSQTEFTLERGTVISPISPTLVEGNAANWTFVPPLPDGLSLGDSNGTIWGTPTVNLTESTFNLRISSGYATTVVPFTFTINEPLATISYGNGSYIVPRDTSVDIRPTLGGGAVASFAINATSLPMGLSFNTSTGILQGIPLLISDNETYIVWANNSGGSVSTTFTLWIVGTGLTLSFPTNELVLVNGTQMQSFAGQTTGSTPETWEIWPSLPGGLSFGISNGTIWGTPSEILAATNFTVWANASGGQTSQATVSITVLEDTDNDAVPDITDGDDDNDLWSDVDEVACGTDPLDNSSTPSDTDYDGTCDALDSVDDSAIAVAYEVSTLSLIVNVSVVNLTPITSGGDITSWSISPELPSGLGMNNTTGVISGTPTNTFSATLFTIWGNNSQYSSSFGINITATSLDTDGDGDPDETDPDDDGDGWSDEDESACSTDPLDGDDFPPDGDGDGFCDVNDPVEDSPISLAYPVTSLNLTVNVTQAALYPILFGGDVVTWEVSPALPAPLLFVTSSGAITGTPTSEFEPTNFTVWANNSQHSSSFVIEMWALLLDTDGDGDPDETDPDDDNDGWSDESELTCLTSTVGPLSFPTDYDGDGVCDNIDDVDDSPLFLVYSVTSQLLFLDEPMTPMAGTVFGGDVRTWEVWPLLPPGLSLNGETARTTYADGTISGAPMVEFEMQSFTIWANNSQFSSSVELTLRAVMPESDDSDFDMIYLEESLNLTAEIDGVYLEPQIFGGNVSSWLITPDLPEGLDFNLTNGVLSGVITMELNSTQYSISASNSMFLHTFTITIAAILLDTDGDGDPDVTDPDDDGDGWSDEDEIECGTDPLDVLSSPEDHDGDSSCDLVDSFDDSPIVFFYPNDKLVLTVGEEMETLAPLVAPTSGGIMNFSVVPELPGGLSLNRSTGEVSGTPTEGFQHLLIEYSHTFTAVNGQWEFSYRVDFDIFPPVDTNPDDDGDGWSDVEEVECHTDPLNSSDYPEDIDRDLICSFLDEDDDGDNIGDLIDAFPKNPTAWEDTDNDTMPDDLTCRYLTDSTNCTFDLIEDLDDDNDGWPDLNETQCAKDPKDNLSIPLDDDGDGVCNLLEEYVPPAVEVLWICCFPLLLMLLMLLWILNPFTVDEEEIMGPEPEFTFTDNEWQGGSGEYDDPFLLREVTGVKPSSFAQSHEIIKISKITPRLICEFSDMSAEENGSRFSMRSIKSDSRGEVEFRLQFRDDGDTPITTTYNGLIRLGKSTVYFLWPVEVDVTKDTPEEEVAKRRATRIEREARKRAEKLEEEASRRVAATENESAQREAEARAEAKRKMEEIEREAEERAAAAEEKAAEAEREAANIAEKAGIEANRKMEEIEREAEERAAAAEEKAAEAELRAAELNVEAARRAEELEKEAQRKATEEEAKLEAERNAAQEEEDRLEAERKAAEEELEEIEREREAAEARARLRKRAEERRLAEEQQRREEEAREAEERAAEERAAEEEATQKEREAEERAAEERAAEEEATQKEREAASKAAEEERESQMKAIKAKEKLRLKAIERKKKMDEEEEEGKIARDMAAARTSAMEAELEQRRANLDQLDEEQRRREVTLIRISERAKDIDFGKIGFATAEEKDGLQAIDGISSFVEEKLNALGIFTFSQLSRMTPKLEDDVNDAIELFPGRVKRDQWVKEAEALNLSSSPDPGTSGKQDEEKAIRAAELLRKAAERKESKEASERALEEALKREKAIEMQRNKARSRAAERISEMESEIERRRGLLSKLGRRERKKEELLIQVMERAAEVDFGIIGFAATDEREDLTKIKGIVPENEVRLNALGIFRYSQIANMTREIENVVCEIIGLGPDQIRLEEWVEQANLF